MCKMIDRLASEKGLVREDANVVFSFVVERIISKAPGLKQMIEDIFEEAAADELKAETRKMKMSIQQQNLESLKTWRMPEPGFIRRSGCQYIL